jgi:hypothetical protein
MVQRAVHQFARLGRAPVALFATMIASALLVGTGTGAAAGPPAATADAAVPVSTAMAAPPPLSGTVSLYGHTITYATGGVSAVPAGHPEWAAYAGVVPVGGTVTLSGSIDFVSPGGLTYLTMWASLNGQGGPMPPDKEVYKKAAATTGTYTMPFSFSEPATASSEAVAAGMSSRNCNDSMVCGGPEILMYIKVVPKGTALSKPPKPKPEAPKPVVDTKAPTVRALASDAIIRKGHTIPARFTVTDDSGKAVMHAVLFSGGDAVPGSEYVSKGLRTADGRVWKTSWPASTGGKGPFFFCVWAVDAAGNTSKGAPKSSCAWISREVPIATVSNGCGTDGYGPAAEWAQNWFGNTRYYGGILTSYRGFPVTVKPACDVHDAAYAGVTVFDYSTGRVVDFRKMGRKAIDQKFLKDIRDICRTELTTHAQRKYLTTCLNGTTVDGLLAIFAVSGGSFGAVEGQIGAMTYKEMVRRFGAVGFDTDVTIPGTQQGETLKSNPAGGIRDIN